MLARPRRISEDPLGLDLEVDMHPTDVPCATHDADGCPDRYALTFRETTGKSVEVSV